ncbi:DinB family protein [Paenibacillus chartarius]|uniref:DinB family protein n=1 Tax=Paenibacillus chartarius TaxID=747481 RepID=A0ABV6DLK9_9BACL
MFTTIQAFVEEWRNVSKNTQRVLDTLTDASLNQGSESNIRPLGQIGWHIATTIHEMISRTGLIFTAPEGEEKAPASAVQIAETYRITSQAMLEAIQNQWTDATLSQASDMYGEQWLNGFTLRVLISHEIHHRGQMFVLMRQAGLRVPDIYGPTREDWIERGIQPLL